MSQEHIFRKSLFNGFNKEDVLDFIEIQKATEAKLGAALVARAGELSEALERIRRLEADVDITLKECERLKSENEKKDSVAQQLGLAIIDARKYSDQLISRSKMEAKRIDDVASKTADDVTRRILAVESEVGQVAKKFAEAFNGLLDELDELKGALGSFAGDNESEPTELRESIVDISQMM